MRRLGQPCSTLDPRSTAAIEDLIDTLSQDSTIVIVTHNLQQAARASDHCAFLHQGELVEFGPTAEFFARPRHERTESYITGRFG